MERFVSSAAPGLTEEPKFLRDQLFTSLMHGHDSTTKPSWESRAEALELQGPLLKKAPQKNTIFGTWSFNIFMCVSVPLEPGIKSVWLKCQGALLMFDIFLYSPEVGRAISFLY